MIVNKSKHAIDLMREFLRLESASGTLLIVATILALIMANIPSALHAYDWFLGLHLTITVGGLGVDKPLLLWINDALMVFFFMLVGLELKREVVEGQLSKPDQVILPIMAAFGGLVLPAAIFWWINGDFISQKNGWAIPTATDIAFALAMLGLLGSRAPLSLKIFLTTIAIVDDIAAIFIIAIFYTSDLSLVSLALAGTGIIGLAILNRMKVMRLAPYMIIALFIWLCVLKSGVHATLAGVVVAAFIPLRAGDDQSPARHLEHTLHPWVAFAVLPVFAFANAGVPLIGISIEKLSNGVPLGIILGLFFGKQFGVFGMVLLARLLRIAKLPENTTWGQIYGVALLCGIGFTMSLFIGTLAFEHGNFDLLSGVKLGVLVGSVLSAIAGLLVLHLTLPKQKK
ncbi:MAG: Na+/H+ antiporter NhaA [Gammaproteobacteria bacterium]|nr:Na+/H+ antiporter NhaA [Gammaproteobacteria bacterium]